MRFNRNGAVLLLLIWAFESTFSIAQTSKVTAATAPTAKAVPQNLLLADDGLAVIAAALDARNRFSNKADCSHLVHDIYERAGFSYSYVPSSDLYAGIDEFRRVTHPQPGDLIVWPGHVGIVISPTRHTFYSSLNSGLGVEPYNSEYWKQRGRPRFLRYVKQAPALEASSVKSPSLKPTSLEAAPSLGSVGTSDADASAEIQPAPVQFPRVLTVESARPTTQEISQAVTTAVSKTAEALRGKSVYGLPQAIVVLSRLDVQRIKIKGTAGWAELQVTESASLSGGMSVLKKRQLKQRWLLHRRDPQNWELIVPEGAVYLNQDDTVRLLAQQLAAMTAEDSPNDVRQKAQVAALLSSLLKVKN